MRLSAFRVATLLPPPLAPVLREDTRDPSVGTVTLARKERSCLTFVGAGFEHPSKSKGGFVRIVTPDLTRRFPESFANGFARVRSPRKGWMGGRDVRSVVRQELGLAQIGILSEVLVPRLHGLSISRKEPR